MWAPRSPSAPAARRPRGRSARRRRAPPTPTTGGSARGSGRARRASPASTHLPRAAHGRDEAVVEAAHVHDAGVLRRPPHRVRFLGVQSERLLAEDVLAVPRGLDRRLGVEVVRPAVVEELDALVGHLLAPVRDASAQPCEPAGLLDLLRCLARRSRRGAAGAAGSSADASRKARECAFPMKA